MRVPIISSLVVPVALLTSCARSTESKLIGTWDVPSSNATTRITYKPDHTWTILTNNRHGISTDTAEWRLEGDEIVELWRGKQVGRIRIVSITADQLRIEDRTAKAILTWSRVK
jgi:hypothetical protein